MIQNVKGTKDILPDEVVVWQRMEDAFRLVTKSYNYEEIRTPVIEFAELFDKSAGEGSDVVSKEMYSFPDRSGEQICLRPELTAPVARAVLQFNLLRAQPTLRLWYYGSCFRYERPQLGRQRQFHQMGAECIGSSNPESDAEIILLASDVLKRCGINDYELQLNTLGSTESRKLFRKELVTYLSLHTSRLSEDSRRRLEKNPLRILDSKDESDKEVIANAPSLFDFLDADSLKHFSELQEILSECSVVYNINHLLVRGLDYYTKTVFEFKTSQLGAQDAIGGGGRYDNLFESLQSKPTPGVGFGIGLERLILLAMKSAQKPSVNPFVTIVSEEQFTTHVSRISHQLRQRGIQTRTDLLRRSFKAQLKDADKHGARFAIILGESEISVNSLIVKDMNTGVQNLIVNDIDLLIENLRF